MVKDVMAQLVLVVLKTAKVVVEVQMEVFQYLR